jgi:8-oxo-dGTP pyrophosphatase MutT (NUDIX family)
MRNIQLECIVFRKKKNKLEFLLLKRIPEKGGFWQPPCGGMEEADKSLLEAAYRELSEEANATKKDVIRVIENVHSFEITKHYLTGEPIPPLKEYVLGFEVKADFTPVLDNNIYIEHEEMRWVGFKEALKLLEWENNKEGFRKLHSLITKKHKKTI